MKEGMDGLSLLLGRVEAASGPDRVLDFELHIALVEDAVWPATDMRGRVTNPDSRMSDYLATYRDVINADDQDFDFPRYTASLDAALALVERAIPGAAVYLAIFPTSATAYIYEDADAEPKPATSKTAPLAVIKALLKAKASQHE